MGRGFRASVIRPQTSKLFGAEFSVWLSSKGNEEDRSMSWMTKGGSSSALAQWPLRYRLNELASSGTAQTAHEARLPRRDRYCRGQSRAVEVSARGSRRGAPSFFGRTGWTKRLQMKESFTVPKD
jgi:hypothetical protein